MLAAYASIGFLVAPWLAGRELPRLVEQRLNHRASIERIAFNPFTLSLRAGGFSLRTKEGGPVLGFTDATIALSWSSLFRRAWVLSEVRLVDPSVHIEISKQGRLNLSALVPDSGDAAPQATPRFALRHVSIANGQVEFEDKQEGYRNRFERLTLELASISNLESETGPYTLAGRTSGGATLGWKGEIQLSPLLASGTLTVANAPLAELSPYLDDFLDAKIAAGHAELELPYRFALAQGEPRLTVAGARLGIRGLDLAMVGSPSPFVKFGQLAVEGVAFDSRTRNATAQRLRVSDVALNARRSAKGELDVTRILRAGNTGKAGAARASAPVAQRSSWHAAIAAIELSNVSASYSDETARLPVSISARGLQGKLKLEADSGADGVRMRLGPGDFRLAQLQAGAAGGKLPAARIADLSVLGVRMDAGSRALDVDSARIGSLDVDASMEAGRLSLLDLVPAGGGSEDAKPFAVRLKSVEIAGGNAALADRDSGVSLALERLGAKLTGASSDAGKPLEFEFSAGIRSGGRIAARGRTVPADGTLEAKLEAAGIALKPLQPMMARFAGVALASGEASFSGTLKTGGKGPKLSYSGSASTTGVAIDDKARARLIGWKSLATNSLRLTLAPNRVEVDELHWIEPAGKLAIASDGTTNLGRAFARKDAPPAAQKEPDESGRADAFPVTVRRVRVDRGQLDFSDDSVSPGFTARITELEGTANGLSSDRTTRGNFALEGRVGEFGFAQLFGALNPFAPRERTGFRVQFRNLDVATVSPYSMKFAGYRIASGRLSLDLNYRVNAGVLQGENKIVLDDFVLGERVASSNAPDLPVELAVALLKDADGRIDLDVPITGSLDDPKFSLSAIVWNAIGKAFRNIVAAPFRALSNLLGGRGEEVGAIAFDPGSSRLLPPEREKLARIVGALAKRPEVKLVIPARYDAEADARAMKRTALVREIGKRAGFDTADDEGPAPISIEDRPTRSALRTLFAERFSAAELDKLKTAAETKEREAGASAGKNLSLLDKVRNFAAGEPQVADPSEFYFGLLRRLRDSQPLPANALTDLAQARAAAVDGALKSAGADPARLAISAAAPSSDAEAKRITLNLAVAAR